MCKNDSRKLPASGVPLWPKHKKVLVLSKDDSAQVSGMLEQLVVRHTVVAIFPRHDNIHVSPPQAAGYRIWDVMIDVERQTQDWLLWRFSCLSRSTSAGSSSFGRSSSAILCRSSMS